MKKIKIICLLLICCGTIFSQDTAVSKIITADSLATGNYKDVLTSFFQLAIENITGPEKEIKFTSNPFAIMLRANPKLLVDTSYRKFRVLRNINFGFNVKLDSNYKFNGFASAINYAIINKRDYTIYKKFPDLLMIKNEEYHKLNRGLTKIRVTLPVESPLRDSLLVQAERLFRDTNFAYSQLDPEVKARIEKVALDSGLTRFLALVRSDENVNVARQINQNDEDVRNSFKNKLLWTVGISDTTYSDQLLFSNVVLSTQLLKGFGDVKKSHGFEIDIKGMYNVIDDTLKAGRDLKRSLLAFEGGLNYVWRSKKTDLSFFEFKMSAAYNRIFNGIYADERKEVFTLNGTFRIRVFEDIWIPVQFKYDPDTGNVFGFLNVKANFTALRNILSR